MAYNYKNTDKIIGIQFGVLESSEILKHSCMSSSEQGILLPESIEGGEPKRNGLSDTRMGVIENNRLCDTCGKDMNMCEGHNSHLRLADPIFNICFLPLMKKILECFCLNCMKPLLDPNSPDVQQIVKNYKDSKRIDKYRQKCKNINICKKRK